MGEKLEIKMARVSRLEEGQDIRRAEKRGTHGDVIPHIVPDE